MKFSDIYFYLWISIAHLNFSDGYKNERLQDFLCADKLLSALKKPFLGDPAVTLTDDDKSAAIVTQVWNVTLPGEHRTNKLKYDCRFRVQTPGRQNRGIYVIITRLRFRQHPVTNDCLDYIEFFTGNRAPTERLCNDISSDGQASEVKVDPSGDNELHVHVHIDKRHMISEPLELRMILTAHSECRFPSDLLCDPLDSFSCISRLFVNDNITNCRRPCRDELYCHHETIATDKMNTTNVAISAITSLIFTMLGVGFCVWICWKYWNCITVQQHAHEASAAAHRLGQRGTPTIEPSAPDFEAIVPNGDIEPQTTTPKDLPPSYDSLFPER